MRRSSITAAAALMLFLMPPIGLAMLSSSSAASASSRWLRLADARIGVSMRYPAGWHAEVVSPDGELVLSSSSFPSSAGSSTGEVLKRLSPQGVFVVVYEQGAVTASANVFAQLPQRPARLALDAAHFSSFEGFGPSYRFSFQTAGRPILILVKLGSRASSVTRARTEAALNSLRYVPLSAREQTIRLPGAPSDLAYGDGSVWTTSEGPASLHGSLLRIDPETSRVVQRIPLPGLTDYSHVAVGAGAVWVSDSGKSSVYRIDPSSGTRVATVHVGGSPVEIAAGAGGVWVVDDRSGRLDHIDPQSNKVAARIKLPDSAGPVAVAGGSVWVIDTIDDQTQALLRIDPRTNRVSGQTPLYRNATSVKAIASSGSYLWLGDRRFLVTRIDTHTGLKLANLSAGGDAVGAYGTVAFGVGPAGGGSDTGIAVQVDANHGEAAPTYPVGRTPVAVAVGPHAAWIANFQDSTLTRIAYH